MGDLILNIGDWWNAMSIPERVMWLGAHKHYRVKRSWGLYTWHVLEDHERERIESALWQSQQVMTAA